LGDNINTIDKNTKALINASKGFDLEVNTEKTKCRLISCHHNAGQNHSIKIANGAFEHMAKFRHLGIHQNLNHEETKSRLNSGNACYHSFNMHEYIKPSKTLERERERERDQHFDGEIEGLH
jgi:hypothetical protein